MARALPVQMHVSFHDVAVWFSEEEWHSLRTWQKTLYLEVMMENYELLRSVGSGISESFPEAFQWEQRLHDGSRESMASRIQTPNTDIAQNVVEDPGVRDLRADNEPAKISDWKSEPVISLNPEVGDLAQSSKPSPDRPCRKCNQLLCQCTGGKQYKKKPYRCIDCGKSYAKESYVLLHQKSHLHGGEYKCMSCEKSFQKPYHLQRHLKTHEVRVASKCKKCEETFTTKQEFTAHWKEKHKKVFKRGGQCHTCGESFDTQKDLWLHRRVHRQVYVCTKCDMRFNKKLDFIRHQRDHKRDERFTCEHCFKVYSRQFTYNKHKNSHSCLKASHKPSSKILKSSITTDTAPDLPRVHVKASPSSSQADPCKRGAWSNKVYKGVIINRSLPFPKTSSDPKETRTGLGPPHPLPQTSSMRYDEWRRNMMYMQPEPSMRHLVYESNVLFSCKTCRKVFRHQASLVRHRHSHTKTYMCRQCGKTFSKLLHVYIHRIEHRINKRHTCEDCRKGFSSKSLLLLHQNVHTSRPTSGGKASSSRTISQMSNSSWLGTRYQCPHCESCFDRFSSILLHAKLHRPRTSPNYPHLSHMVKKSSVCPRALPPLGADTRV